MMLRDKYGWPVTTYEGFHPILNTLRRLIHTNIRRTWQLRKSDKANPFQVVYNSAVQAQNSEHVSGVQVLYHSEGTVDEAQFVSHRDPYGMTPPPIKDGE